MSLADFTLLWLKLLKDKSNSTASKIRDEGTELYKHGKCFSALERYNLSLCYALPGSQDLALAYGNRSAVYFQAKFYAECLDNIKLARENGFPADKMKRLEERENKCKKMMECGAETGRFDPRSFFKLSYPANENVPFIVNCLELRQDEKYGKYVITNRDLKAGDVIAIEESLIRFSHRVFRVRRCFICLNTNNLNLIPSPISAALYCSQECIDKDVFHRTLARFEESSTLTRSELSNLILRSFRPAQKLDEIFDALCMGELKTVFDLDSSAMKNREIMWYKFISLWKDLRFNFDDEIEELPLTKKEELLLEFFIDIRSITRYNENPSMDPETIFNDSDEKVTNREVGSGMRTLMSIFNHSCYPNVHQTAMDCKEEVFIVMRPIKAGEQLFTSYGPDFFYESLQERQESMKHYDFKCDCVACINDYPKLEKLPRQSFKQPPNPVNFKEEIEHYKRNCIEINLKIRETPCIETAFYLIYNSKFIRKLYVPFLSLKDNLSKKR